MGWRNGSTLAKQINDWCVFWERDRPKVCRRGRARCVCVSFNPGTELRNRRSNSHFARAKRPDVAAASIAKSGRAPQRKTLGPRFGPKQAVKTDLRDAKFGFTSGHNVGFCLTDQGLGGDNRSLRRVGNFARNSFSDTRLVPQSLHRIH